MSLQQLDRRQWLQVLSEWFQPRVWRKAPPSPARAMLTATVGSLMATDESVRVTELVAAKSRELLPWAAPSASGCSGPFFLLSANAA